MCGAETLWSGPIAEQMRRLLDGCPCASGERCPILGDGRQAERVEPLSLPVDLRVRH